MLPICEFHTGCDPLLISMPHNGTLIPHEIAEQMTVAGVAVPDTDWNLEQLYDFHSANSSSRIIANYSRYVIDLNRSLDGSNLYPGQPTPELVPRQTFAGQRIYIDAPDPADVQARIEGYWQPYHAELRNELDRLKSDHSIAVLFDAHSIASRVPRLFQRSLPDINIGTNNGRSCDPGLQRVVADCLAVQNDYSHVINGRFIGGYITRTYGDPAKGIHAVQLELSQATYMDENRQVWDTSKAKKIQPVLQSIVDTIVQWAKTR